MEILAAALLGVFAVGYLVLAGADIGVGMLLPFLGRDARERRLVIAAIAPFFLGNEVWLVTATGLLAGAYPGLEERLLHGLFPLVVALLLGWVVRDMGLWLRGRVDGRRWRATWDAAIFLGSWVVALSWGAILGSVLAGGHGMNAGTALGVAAAALFALHGAAFAALRLTGPPRARAGRPRAPFAATAAVMAALPLLAGARLPLSAAAAGDGALTFTATTAAVLLPLLLAAQALVWWTFRHRVDGPSYL